MPARSSSTITDIFPLDILNLILQEVCVASHGCPRFLLLISGGVSQVKRTDPKSLQSLRLASKGLNDQVEPLAFASVQLLPYTRLREFQAQLRRLASGQSPNSRWTKRLDIGPGSLAPPLKAQYRAASTAGPRRHSALVTQKKHLARAIEALRNVTFVRYHPHDVEPYEEVLGAMSRLPNLQHVSLSFSSDFDDEPLPLSSFSNLRVIELEYPRFFPSVVISIQGMLESSSETLDSLFLMPLSWERQFGWAEPPSVTSMIRVVGLHTLLEGVEKPVLAPGVGSDHEPGLQYPRLKRVVLNTDRIGLSAPAVQYLTSLVHLDAMNATTGNIEDSFWRELTRSKVRLEFLRIWPLTTSAIGYLASYTGLKTLILRDPEDEEQAAFFRERQLERLLNVVLPRHSTTLENLWLEGSGVGEYYITEEILGAITRCHRLQNLWVLYHFPDTLSECEVPSELESGYGFVEMDVLLSQITASLPRLQHLILRPMREIPRFGCKTGETGYMNKVATQFRDAISQAEIAEGMPSFAISVRGITGGCMMHFDGEAKRFTVGDT